MKFVSMQMENTPKSRVGHSCVSPNENSIFVFGGYVVQEGYVMDCLKFNTLSNIWTNVDMQSLTKDAPLGRVGHSTTMMSQNRVLLMGGMRNQIMLDDMWLIYMDNFSWEPLKIVNNNTDPLFGHQTFLLP